MSYSSSSGGGIFVSGLTLLFIYLKITDKIDWSWFWVLSPMIFSTILGLIVLIGILIYLYYRDVVTDYIKSLFNKN